MCGKRRWFLLPAWAILLLAVSPARGEIFSIGVRGGVPLTDFFDTASRGSLAFFSDTKPYVVGPAVELHLPFRLGIGFDALYRRVNYESTEIVGGAVTATRTTGNSWEFPLLLRWRFSGAPITPFVNSGVAFRHLSGLRQVRSFFTDGTPSAVETDRPPELENRTSPGFVAGGGLELRAGPVRISPEIRYTRWGWTSFRDVDGLLRSKNGQADFLVGFTF